jgi:hypothetical protein
MLSFLRLPAGRQGSKNPGFHRTRKFLQVRFDPAILAALLAIDIDNRS